MKVAIVEDDKKDMSVLLEYIERFQTENDTEFKTTVFTNGVDFISDYKPEFDIVFLDIQMPYLDGMQTAKKLRKIDGQTILIFYTNMVRYALAGYSVNALDFLVKPATYADFEKKIKKAIKQLKAKKDRYIIINDGSVMRINISDILYVEKNSNKLIWYTLNGNYAERCNLYEREKELESFEFAKCRSGCMVNLAHVTRCTSQSVFLGEIEIPISRGEQKFFVKKVLACFHKDSEIS